MHLRLNHLRQLESESIYIFREAQSEFSKPALLFSGGKDSIVMTHLAKKAFWPGDIPFPLIHIDTGHNFKETIAFRDSFIGENNLTLLVGYVEESIKNGLVKEEKGPNASRNSLQSTTLLEMIEKHQFDCCFGGGRRDEEKARAKERVFSFRNEFGSWDPKAQRPELWSIFNCRKDINENFRVFPLSNWTELDIWEYIQAESIKLPSLYFAHDREVIMKNGTLYGHDAQCMQASKELVKSKRVRFRTIGDITCTGAVESNAASIEEVINEISTSPISERGSRTDDQRSEAAMEDRKRQGYF